MIFTAISDEKAPSEALKMGNILLEKNVLERSIINELIIIPYKMPSLLKIKYRGMVIKIPKKLPMIFDLAKYL